jgi:hypothetical protein
MVLAADSSVPPLPHPRLSLSIATGPDPDTYILTPKDKTITNVGSLVKSSKKKIEWTYEYVLGSHSVNHRIQLMHSVNSMRVRISVDDQLRHESQQRKGVPKWVYLLTVDGLKCAITIDYSNEEDPYFLYIDDVPFRELGLKPGTPGSPRKRSNSAIPSDIAKMLPRSSKWAYREDEDNPAVRCSSGPINDVGDASDDEGGANPEAEPRTNSKRRVSKSFDERSPKEVTECASSPSSPRSRKKHSVSEDLGPEMDKMILESPPGRETAAAERRLSIKKKSSGKDIRLGSGTIDTASMDISPAPTSPAPPVDTGASEFDPFAIMSSVTSPRAPPAPCNSPTGAFGAHQSPRPVVDPFDAITNLGSGAFATPPSILQRGWNGSVQASNNDNGGRIEPFSNPFSNNGGSVNNLSPWDL